METIGDMVHQLERLMRPVPCPACTMEEFQGFVYTRPGIEKCRLCDGFGLVNRNTAVAYARNFVIEEIV